MARYQVLAEIGRGATGVVLRAFNVEKQRIVALKLLDDAAARDGTEVARLEREAAALKHPNIVKVIEAGTLDGRPYVAMEIVEGDDLFKVSKARKPLPTSEVVGWMAQAADALAYVHSKGILHRDVKPSNLLVDALGRVTLTDFGLARDAQTPGLTAPGTIVGTPRFLAPEQLMGTPAGPAQDVYALGVSIIEVLAGDAWCGRVDGAALYDRIARGAPPDLAALRPDAPEWLVSAIGFAVHRDPASRPTAAVLADALATQGEGASSLASHATAKVPLLATYRERFRVIERIGSGGMGTVYRAEQLALKREVALKCMRTDMGPDEECRVRFRREALALTKISHPGVVKIFDVSEEGQDPYIAMELVRGITLEDMVLENPVEVQRRGVPLFMKIVEAVAALHAAGLIHRDLKPGNIMVTPAGQSLVMDLGLVKDGQVTIADLTRTGAIIGTPTYLAPETLNGKPATKAADVWALGGIWYMMNAGAPPFRGDSLQTLFRAIAIDPLPDFAVLCPDLSESARILLAHLFERDPAKRPRDAGRVVEGLKRVMAGRNPLSGIRSRPSIKVLGKRAAGGSRLVAAALAISGVAAVGTLALLRPVAPTPSPAPSSSEGPAIAEQMRKLVALQARGAKLSADFTPTKLKITLSDDEAAEAEIRELHSQNREVLDGARRINESLESLLARTGEAGGEALFARERVRRTITVASLREDKLAQMLRIAIAQHSETPGEQKGMTMLRSMRASKRLVEVVRPWFEGAPAALDAALAKGREEAVGRVLVGMVEVGDEFNSYPFEEVAGQDYERMLSRTRSELLRAGATPEAVEPLARTLACDLWAMAVRGDLSKESQIAASLSGRLEQLARAMPGGAASWSWLESEIQRRAGTRK